MKKLLEERAALPYSREWLHQWTLYHENHAARIFHQYTGVSPHEYHMIKKNNRAQKLLQDTPIQIAQIAEQLHFSSIHYFSKAFKKFTGLPRPIKGGLGTPFSLLTAISVKTR